jgi:outer membrane murein-binding lipoprotein Lpp
MVVTLLAACSASQQEGKEKSAAQAPKNPAQETVFKDMVGTMDKARAVEDTAAQHKQQLDQALQQAEGEPPER